jgi:hypothetical protein
MSPVSALSGLAENTACDISSIVVSCTTSSPSRQPIGLSGAAQQRDINTRHRKRSPTVVQLLGCLVSSYNTRYCCLMSQRIAQSTCHLILTQCCVTSPAHTLYSIMSQGWPRSNRCLYCYIILLGYHMTATQAVHGPFSRCPAMPWTNPSQYNTFLV